MSFQTSIYGNAPANTFVYTTTTVSVDNISVENLSATNATISVLKTDLFSPVNVDATNIDCTNLTVLDTGNFSEIYTSYIHTSNMSLDGTLGGHTGNFVTINADHAIVDALYINEQSVVLTDKSLIKRDGNQVMFIGKNSSTDVTGADFLFRTGLETDAVKLTIPRSSDIIGMIALDVDTTIQATTGVFAAINTSDLNVADTTTLSELEVLTSASIKNLNVIGPNGLTATKGTITNFSSTKSTLTNASIGNLSISGNFNASGTSRFYNLTAEYFQSYITGVFQDMDAVTGNITTFESNNISNNILIKTNNLSAVNTSISNDLRVGSNILCDSMNVTNVLTASTLSAATVNAGILLNASTMNALLVNTSNLSAINASVDNKLNVRFGVTCGSVNASTTITAPKINGTNVSVTNISATRITGDVSQNLSAGFGIALTTVGGVTTIANTGGSVTDPLNLSTLNASTINVSLLNADNIEGFTQSTEYAFRSTSDAEDTNPIVTVGFVAIPFNEHSAPPPQLPWEPYCVPDISAYNKALYQYTVPVSGIWEFGWQIYILSPATQTVRLRLIIDGAEALSTGSSAGNIESAKFVGYLNAGAVVYIKNTNTSSIQLNLSRKYSFWYGNKLTPANNLITSTTNLSIQNLSVSNEMTAAQIRGTTIMSSPIISGGEVLTNTGLITTLGSTTINASKLNASNISVSGEIDFGTAITGPLVAVNEIIASQCSLFGLRVNSSASIDTLNASNINTSNISSQNLSVSNDITALNIIGNISQNLAAGTGINLSTVGGITTISNTGGSVTDPLNLSTLNASTINVSTLNADNIEGFTKSTEYTFKAYSNLGDAITIGPSATTIQFNTLTPDGYSVPDVADYNTATSTYTIPVAGYWVIGYKLRQRSVATTSALISLFRNSVAYAVNGNYTANGEGLVVTLYCDVGDRFYIRTNSGTFSVDLRPEASYFYGYKLTPANNLITSTTNLSIQNLSVSNDITALNISATDMTIATSLTGAGSINITGDVSAGIVNATTLTGNIGGNLSAGTGIVLSTAAGVTNISNSAPYQLPASRVYARITQNTESPLDSSLVYYTTFNTLTLNSPHVSFTPPNISTGGANTGFIINTQGTYKITFTQCVHSISYTNRVAWWTRLLVNGTPQYCATFIYTRSDNSQYAQYGSGSTSQILVLEVGDYLQLRTNVAKNSAAFNNNWTGLEGYSGSSFILELLT